MEKGRGCRVTWDQQGRLAEKLASAREGVESVCEVRSLQQQGRSQGAGSGVGRGAYMRRERHGLPCLCDTSQTSGKKLALGQRQERGAPVAQVSHAGQP